MINKSSLSFGHYLKATRIENGISLDEVSEKTKIRIDNLLLVEKEDHVKLPSEVFVKGFLRAYAEAVGADGDEAARRYTSSLNAYQTNAKAEADFDNLNTKFWPHLLLSLGAIICIITLSVFVMSVFDAPIKTDNQVKTDGGHDNNKTDKGIDNIASKVDNGRKIDSALVGKRSEKSLLLSVISIETTWIKVIIDGRMPKEYSLEPRDRLELEAFNGFNLLIGNATGVQLLLNDKPIEILGKKGQVVNVQLP